MGLFSYGIADKMKYYVDPSSFIPRLELHIVSDNVVFGCLIFVKQMVILYMDVAFINYFLF